ncbi:unnamed protein product [Sphenostylis stenocarpa]|uniref:Uncharacterized protein n=1 Tax=Sphenostylis stenocarpa TaxID=92480 RepID=A0AA86VD45_9FABA|nr:unnamed protein product [Sphenostylis stenocarpa]
MRNPVGFRLMMFMVCLVLRVVFGAEEIRCIPEEREALLQFKSALVDRYGMLSSWTTPHCCQWQGIRCSNLTAHVLSLHLHGERGDFDISPRYISGEIHKSLMELRELEYLNLSSNSFPDSHIPEFLGSLRNLRYLDLSYSNFVGKIPSQLGSLSHLKYLNLAGNSLKGTIPRQLENLSQLQYLDLRSNSFEGNLPSQLGNLSNLQELYLGRYYHTLKVDDGGQWLTNLFSLTHLYMESISNLNHSHSWLQVIAKLPNLRELSLVDCSLSDHFILSWRPFKLNFSTSLSVLHLSENSFTSPMIFQWVSNITSNLVELDLSFNLLEGSTSGHFGTVMNSLRHLDLSSNRFKGGDMKSFANICTLHSLNLIANNLTESLPSILGNLSSGCVKHSLQELDMSYNDITGTLPDLSIFPSLETLVLDQNNLNRKIPEGVRLPSNLEVLSIKSNSLEGGIPKSFGNACVLGSLDLSNNNLNVNLPMIIHHLSGCARNSLKELRLGGNKISGTLLDLSIFSTLQVLDLSNNQLNGKIPEVITLPSTLEALSISSNSLEGGVPKSFGNACALGSLDLSYNNLNIDLQVIIHHLSGCARNSLQKLSLGENNINGTFLDFSIFSTLEVLDLSNNQLNGNIPEVVWLPANLEVLSISSNSLEGGVPKSFGNACALRSLEMSNNRFSGEFRTIIHHLSGCARYSLEVLNLGMNQIKGTLPNLSTFTTLKELYLYGNKLNGDIPKDIQFPPHLEDLDMQSNFLKGVLSEYHFTNMSNLKTLELSDNSLALDFIQNWVPPFQLQIIGLRSCNLGPAFPKWLQTQNEIHDIDISNATISDIVPEWFWAKSQFQSLAYLDLSHNKFSGKIPTSMGSLLDLQALLLRNNSLVGEIPFSLRNWTKLVMLDMSENKLSGSVPAWIGTKKELQILSLGGNRFYGSLPLQICCLRKIQLLDLSLNNLSGKIPKCIKNFTSMAETTSSNNGDHRYVFILGGFSSHQLYYLNAFLTWKGSKQLFENKGLSLLISIDLSSNHFSEEIPVEIEKLSGLISLNLSRNKLIGKIPSNIGKLASLESLDLSRNQLIGSIPQTLTQIYGLGVLDLSHNYLTRQIPTGTQLQSFNSSSYEDNLDLCGPPLKKLCIDGGRTQEPKVEVDEEEDSFLNNEFLMSMGFGFVVSFWMVFGSILFKRSWRHTYFQFLNNLADNIHVKVTTLLAKILKLTSS